MSNVLEPNNFSRTHYKNEVMEYFSHFVSCYFIADYHYSELPYIIEEYKKIEEVFMSEGLLKELIFLKERGEWYYIQKFIQKNGLRKLSIKKLQNMFDLMIDALSLKVKGKE